MKHYKGEEIKNEYFNLSMYDLEDGLSIDDLRNLLQEYENNEMYWECAGIQKAIDQMTFRILTLIVFSGDLMGSIVGIVCGAGLVFVITGKISFLRT